VWRVLWYQVSRASLAAPFSAFASMYAHGAENGAMVRGEGPLFGLRRHLGDSEVENLEPAFARDEEVLGLQIAVTTPLSCAARNPLVAGSSIISLRSELTRPCRNLGPFLLLCVPVPMYERIDKRCFANPRFPSFAGTRRSRLARPCQAPAAQGGKEHVLGRVGRPDEIASVAAFLASDDARWVSRAVLDVSGGWN
jgi:hypothetical protein